MANSIRNIITLYGPLDEADRFIGRFTRGGMDAFVPLMTDSNTLHDYMEVWGAGPEYGDFEVLTDTSIVAGQHSDGISRPRINSIGSNWANYNKFTLADHHKSILALELPGFAGQEQTPVAIIVFHTKWSIPHHWIEAVINAEYRRGLVLHMQSYDIVANAEIYMPEYGGTCEHFHAYTSTGTEFIQSGRCAIMVDEKEAPPPSFDEINNGDYDPCLPQVDDEGNELQSFNGNLIVASTHPVGL